MVRSRGCAPAAPRCPPGEGYRADLLHPGAAPDRLPELRRRVIRGAIPRGARRGRRRQLPVDVPPRHVRVDRGRVQRGSRQAEGWRLAVVRRVRVRFGRERGHGHEPEAGIGRGWRSQAPTPRGARAGRPGDAHGQRAAVGGVARAARDLPRGRRAQRRSRAAGVLTRGGRADQRPRLPLHARRRARQHQIPRLRQVLLADQGCREDHVRAGRHRGRAGDRHRGGRDGQARAGAGWDQERGLRSGRRAR